MITNIRPIKTDGEHWISVSIDGCELKRRGPFPDATTAEATANRVAAICRGLFHGGVHIHRVVPTAPHQHREKHP